MRKFWLLLSCRLTIGLLAGALTTVGATSAQAEERLLELQEELAEEVTSVELDGLVAALKATARNHPALASESAKVRAARYAASAERTQRFPSAAVVRR